MLFSMKPWQVTQLCDYQIFYQWDDKTYMYHQKGQQELNANIHKVLSLKSNQNSLLYAFSSSPYSQFLNASEMMARQGWNLKELRLVI